MIRNRRYFITGIVIAALVAAIDQASKWWMLVVLDIANRPPIEVTGFFNLVMVWNHGISFGMLADERQPLILILLALAIVAVLLRWLAKENNRWLAIGIGFVIGGAMGNVIDRVRFGAVADFFDFHVMGAHWPAFNVADSAIFMGVVVLCIQSMIEPRK